MSSRPKKQRKTAENTQSGLSPSARERLFQITFYQSPALQSVVRASDGAIIEVNDAFLQKFRRTREKTVGKSPMQLNSWVQPEELLRFKQDLETKGVVRNREVQLRAEDGTVFTALLSSHTIEIDGTPHFLAAGIDITDRKEAEAKLVKAEAELQQALANERELSQLKSDFVNVVSHEFRTPLEIIMSSADNLERYHDRLPEEKRTQLLRTINKSVRRMSQMMEEVLVLGRLEKDRVTFKPSTINLKSICQRLADEISSTTGQRCPIAIHVDEISSEAVGDESLVRHILTNLLSNAVKYSPEGEPVEFSVCRDANDAVFTVRDHGFGIPDADQKRIFQAFHRGGNVRQIPGTGLGLLIVRRCVDLHGGEITFESREGKGTTFTVRLPLFNASAKQRTRHEKNPRHRR